MVTKTAAGFFFPWLCFTSSSSSSSSGSSSSGSSGSPGSSSLRKLRRNFRSTESASIGCAKGEKVPLQSGPAKSLHGFLAP